MQPVWARSNYEARDPCAPRWEISMVKRGDVFDNPITGERATIRLGTRETRGERMVVDLELRGGRFWLRSASAPIYP